MVRKTETGQPRNQPEDQEDGEFGFVNRRERSANRLVIPDDDYLALTKPVVKTPVSS